MGYALLEVIPAPRPAFRIPHGHRHGRLPRIGRDGGRKGRVTVDGSGTRRRARQRLRLLCLVLGVVRGGSVDFLLVDWGEGLDGKEDVIVGRTIVFEAILWTIGSRILLLTRLPTRLPLSLIHI